MFDPSMWVGLGTVFFVGTMMMALIIERQDAVLARIGKLAATVLVASYMGTMAATTFLAVTAKTGTAATQTSALQAAGKGLTPPQR